MKEKLSCALSLKKDVKNEKADMPERAYPLFKAVAEFYENEEYKYCLFQSGPENVDGYGNHVIEVKNSQGIITQAMILIDSQAYVKDNIIESIKGTYDNVHPNQVEWYES